MVSLKKTTRLLFQAWGSKGGRKRARGLSPERRAAIAAFAARARWETNPLSSPPLPSVRLERPDWEDPVYLEEILSQGGLEEWRELYHRVLEHPFGSAADSLQKVLQGVKIYGVTALWRSILNILRGGQ